MCHIRTASVGQGATWNDKWPSSLVLGRQWACSRTVCRLCAAGVQGQILLVTYTVNKVLQALVHPLLLLVQLPLPLLCRLQPGPQGGQLEGELTRVGVWAGSSAQQERG